MPLLEPILSAFARLGAQTGHGSELQLRQLVLQLAVILIASSLGARIAKRWLGQPPVIGQILAGIALGPTLLGAAFPKIHAYILPAQSLPLLGNLAELGLVLLVFQVGLEIDFRKQLTGGGVRAVAAIGLCAFVVPLGVGFLVAPFFAGRLGAQLADPLAFRMMFACALAITAVPVLARVFHELGVTHTRTAALSIGAAALNDVLGWVVLGGIAAYTRGSWNGLTLLTQIVSITLGLGLVFLVVGPLLSRIVGWELAANQGRLPPRAIGWVLLVVCVAAVVSSTIGVFALIGGLVIGVALHGQRALAAEWERSVAPLVHALFVPLFFTLTGLRTDLGALHGAQSFFLCGLVVVLAVATKLGSGYLAARAFGEPHRTALAVGVAMNTRGLMELVALNIGLELGILPRSMFSLLVLAAITCTYVASPLLRHTLGLAPSAPAPVPAFARPALQSAHRSRP